jgi:glycosyltransferase involved in cell wall biosynthesis
MKVLIVTQYFPPEIGATQNRLHAFARALADSGADVDVLTEIPNHPAGVIPPEYAGRWLDVSAMDGFRVVRVRFATAVRKTFWTRMSFYLSFVLMSLVGRRKLADRYDVVLATSPPLPAAGAGLILARWTRARFILDVRDLWPTAAGALGELQNRSLYRAAEWLERRLYRAASRILVTTRAFAADLEARGVPASRLLHVPNGARLDLFVPSDQRALRRSLGMENAFVVTYAGLHGIAQGLELLLDAAARMRPGSRTHFLFIGDGPRKAALQQSASARGLTNVTFLPAVPVDACARYLSASDVLLVPLAPHPIFAMFVPSKLFDSMACARPVVLMVDGEARAILEEAGAGRFVRPGDVDGLIETLAALEDDPAQRAEMGTRGRRFVEAYYSRDAQSRMVVDTVAAVAGMSQEGRS